MNKIDTIGRHIFYKKRNEKPYIVQEASATPAEAATTLSLASAPADSISATPALSLGVAPSE
jgi:hypothetical protein